MIKLFEDKEQCYGCGACANICPQKAIIMKQDTKGFLYPNIEDDLCIECGLCQKTCQIKKENQELNEKSENCFAIKSDNEIRLHSSSGGIYTVISDIVLEKGGVCAGVKFDEHFNVIYDLADTYEKRNEFRGSKYVQSDMRDVFLKIKQCLEAEQQVLFTGTPCQVSALKQYLHIMNVDSKLLLTVDLVCHGAPSPKVWKDYVNELERVCDSKLVEFSFRDKKNGWAGYHIYARFKNGITMHDDACTQSFVRLFTRDLILRSSCYHCSYTCLRRPGDITIGDFWGIENIDADFSDNMGVSMVLFNSSKGINILNKIKDKVDIREFKSSTLSQPNLYRSTMKSFYYDDFWKTYQRAGYKKVAEKYGGYGKKQFIYHFRDIIDYRILNRK